MPCSDTPLTPTMAEQEGEGGAQPQFVRDDVITLDLTSGAEGDSAQPPTEVELTGFMVTPGADTALEQAQGAAEGQDPILYLAPDEISRLENVLQSDAAKDMLGEVLLTNEDEPAPQQESEEGLQESLRDIILMQAGVDEDDEPEVAPLTAELSKPVSIDDL